MTRNSYRLGRLVVLAIGLATILIPAANAGVLRSSGVGETEVTSQHGLPYPRGMNPAGTSVKASFDHQSPDARDAAIAAVSRLAPTLPELGYNVAAWQQAVERGLDLRSPDARDAGIGGDSTGYLVDSRSPDARDAAQGRPTSAPTVEIVRIAEPVGFSWDDAGIGALGAFVLMLIAGSGALVIRSKRRTRLVNA